MEQPESRFVIETKTDKVMRTKDIKPIKKVHLDNFHIAGFG